MKIRERALAILLSMVMMLTFMPALAFAEEADSLPNEGVTYHTNAVDPDDVSDIQVKITETDYNLLIEEWHYSGEGYFYSVEVDDGDEMHVYSGSEYATYKYDGYGYDEDADETVYKFVNEDSSDVIKTSAMYFEEPKRIEVGKNYDFETTAYIGDEIFTCNVELTVIADSDRDAVSLVIAKNDALYELAAQCDQKYDACREAQKIELDKAYEAASDAIWSANTTAEVNTALASGKAAIAAVKTDAQLKSEEAAAATEAARQGTPDGSLPKVKIAKPKAAKKAATVKWKKLNKKQLKKAQKIEIWVCPNGGFGPNDTIMKTAGKKKASLKVKGLKKGTYYVKVRAIKYVGGTKMVGPWSKVKKVKIKK